MSSDVLKNFTNTNKVYRTFRGLLISDHIALNSTLRYTIPKATQSCHLAKNLKSMNR